MFTKDKKGQFLCKQKKPVVFKSTKYLKTENDY